MTEQQTEQYDPADHTVDEVNAYLAENPDQVDTVLVAEADGKNRQGIVTGPHADGGAADGPESTNDAPEGYTGAVAPSDGDDPNAVRTADQAAPDGAADDGPRDDAPATLKDAGAAQDLDQHPKGYVGTLPDEDDRPDLTLSGVIARGV